MIEKILVKEVVAPVIIIVVALVIYEIIKKIIKKVFKFKARGIDSKRLTTIQSLFTNVVKVFIIVIVIMMILDVYGIDTKSILASLGVFTAVLALALQDILKDFVAGITIMLEGQYRIGDTITVNSFKGEVISLTLKTTRVKAYTGEIKILANRSISEVINHNLDDSLAIVDVGVAYESDLAKVEKVLTKLCEKLSNDLENLTGPVELLGVNSLGTSSITYRITATTVSMKQYEIQRKMMREVKLELDKNNIAIPYSQLVVHNG
jgi:small conductance mechanosensitive channel